MELIKMKCEDCKNHCCIGDYATFLTLHDARRISNATGITMDRFCFYGPICADKEGQEELMQSMDHTYFDFSRSGNVLQLKAGKGGSCFFLNKKRCTIYNTRPLICRIFPFWYKKQTKDKEKLKLIIDDDCGDCWIMKKRDTAEICKNLGYTEAEMRALIAQFDAELKHYKKYESDLTASMPSEIAKKQHI